MRKVWKLFGMSAMGLSVLGLVDVADAANPGRGRGAQDVRVVDASGGQQVARMPSMPTMPINTIGNMTPDLPVEQPSKSGGGIVVVPSNPGGGGGDGGEPDTPDTPDTPDVPDTPDTPDTPANECADGGVRDSSYTINSCMADIKKCVNTNGLPNGLNDLFDEDLRNSIVNGMGLCRSQVEHCIETVRRNCANMYRSSADVWIDFNARVVQPEYYTFVLRQTGLTPNQAENTCMLLDKNTYGSSFAAVSATDNVSKEYKDTVAAYNDQKDNKKSVFKVKPQGATPAGNPAIDSNRGHYARWDATKGQCLVRVAAYNKDKHITNKWLGIGDDTPAEQWVPAGTTFTCNKDFFGFSLMNQTKSAALLGVTSGVVLGAGIGAATGHKAEAFSCEDDAHRKELYKQLRATGQELVLSQYLDNPLTSPISEINAVQCREILHLKNKLAAVQSAIERCRNGRFIEQSDNVRVTYRLELEISGGTNGLDVSAFCAKMPDVANCESVLAACTSLDANCVKLLKGQMDLAEQELLKEMHSKKNFGMCHFKTLNLAIKEDREDNMLCSSGPDCHETPVIQTQILEVQAVLDKLTVFDGRKSTYARNIGIGVAAGAGAGGVATLITAFVEKGNISCRIGDGLDQVSLNKSHTVDSLKDYYVKWALNLPDTVQPTAHVVDCASWRNACGGFPTANQCEKVQINYMPADATSPTLVQSACTMIGSVCMENTPVARTAGACQ